MKAVELLELVAAAIVVIIRAAALASRRRRGQLDRDGFNLAVSTFCRSARQRLVHSLVAGVAAIKPSDIPKIIVKRELRQPKLVDAQRAVKGVQHWQLQYRLAKVGRAILERLGKQQQFLAMVGQRLCRGVFGGREFFERCFKRLAVRVGRLRFERGRQHLSPRRVRHGKQRCQGLWSHILCNAQFVIGPVFIQLRLAQLEMACAQILPKLRAAGDVAKPLEQVAPEHQPLGWVGLLPEHVDIQLTTVGRFGIGRHRANLGQKRLSDRGI